jgi:hypothetical protein
MTLKNLKKGQKFKFTTANSKRIYEYVKFDGVNHIYWGRFNPWCKHYKTVKNKTVEMLS